MSRHIVLTEADLDENIKVQRSKSTEQSTKTAINLLTNFKNDALKLDKELDQLNSNEIKHLIRSFIEGGP